ncbi:MAG: DUF3011 domain-containing protein [Acidobacteria bacterium]|nr:DUF3011 domain-containing protein [Acidobacteriota bacterium]
MKISTGLLTSVLILGSIYACAEEVTCESRGNRRQECTINASGSVRIMRQLSDAPCVEGRTWGYTQNSLWVSDGCRGVFAFDADSPDRLLSRRGGGGQEPLPTYARCESIDNRQEECSIDTSGSVRIIRQISDAPCVEGQTWGYFNNSLWVSDGCRAVFVSDTGTSPKRSRERPNAAIRACRAHRSQYGQLLNVQEIHPGFMAIILRYADGDYACVAGETGTVSSFEKLLR